MRKILYAILFFSFFNTSCTTTKPTTSTAGKTYSNSSYTYSGGNGSSYEDAVIVMEKSEGRGVNAEYAWLKEHYKGYKMISQSLQNKNSKSYDVLDIVTSEGESKSIYFDITNFFGKF